MIIILYHMGFNKSTDVAKKLLPNGFFQAGKMGGITCLVSFHKIAAMKLAIVIKYCDFSRYTAFFCSLYP